MRPCPPQVLTSWALAASFFESLCSACCSATPCRPASQPSLYMNLPQQVLPDPKQGKQSLGWGYGVGCGAHLVWGRSETFTLHDARQSGRLDNKITNCIMKAPLHSRIRALPLVPDADNACDFISTTQAGKAHYVSNPTGIAFLQAHMAT